MDDFGLEALLDSAPTAAGPGRSGKKNVAVEVDDLIRAREERYESGGEEEASSPGSPGGGSEASGSDASGSGEDDGQSSVGVLSVVSSSRSRSHRHKQQQHQQGGFVPRLSEEAVRLQNEEKRELLYQFDRLQKKGYRLPRQFTMASDVHEMRAEFERIKRDRDVDASIAFQRKMVIGAVSGIEYLNGKFDPLNIKLDGWSEGVQDKISDLDDVFEALYEKYKSKGSMPPELRLLLSIGGAAVGAHITNTLFKNSLPGMDQVLKQNPGLRQQFASAAMGTMAGNVREENGGTGNVTSGLAGLMSNILGGGGGGGGGLAGLGAMFGGGGGGGPAPKPVGKMRGPGNFDAMLRETQNFAPPEKRRVEVFAAENRSDDGLSELHEDNISLSGLSLSSKKNKRILSL